MYLVKTPGVVQPFSKRLLWKGDPEGGAVYLTFDDGPNPGVTDKVLDILDAFDAAATFFCIGGNVEKYPELYAEMLQRGHAAGNHTWNHMNGRSFSDYSYFKNVLECARVVDSKLFRPPYGSMKLSQVKAISKRYTIVMWDVLSADWRKELSPERCLRNVTSAVEAGSVVVFHDSDKAAKNMLYTLPRVLEFLAEKGLKPRTLKGVKAAR